jgi:methyltransferase (TIGR00027 family)
VSSRALVEDVSDTARWVAYYRALESERPDALFHDPFARRLAGERGHAMAESMAPGALPWAIPVRTRVYDDLILETVAGGEITAVLNLAAGLDARPYRLALPGSLRWVEADLPGIIAWKTDVLAKEQPCCPLERVALDLTDRRALTALTARIAAEHERVLVVTEGLLVYLEEAAVRALADDLRACPAIRSWVLESAAPEVLARNQRAWGKTLKAADAEMKFAPASGLGFFRDHGWAPCVRRSAMHEAHRLGREMRFGPLLRALKSLTARGREWLRDVVVYAVMDRDGSPPSASR